MRPSRATKKPTQAPRQPTNSGPSQQGRREAGTVVNKNSKEQYIKKL